MTLLELLELARTTLGVSVFDDDYYIEPDDDFNPTYQYTGNGGGVAMTATWYSDGEPYGNGFGKATWMVEASYNQRPRRELIKVVVMRLEDPAGVNLESLKKCLLETIPTS